MQTFKEFLESLMLDPSKISLTRPNPQHRTNVRMASNKEKPNLVASRYKLQANESPGIKAIQLGTQKRVVVPKQEVQLISKKYNLQLAPGVEKCINSNSRIFIKLRPNGTAEVYKR